MNEIALKQNILSGQFTAALDSLDRVEGRLSVGARNQLTASCQELADEHGFGRGVELVIGLSRELRFLLADPEVDQLETIRVPLPASRAVCRLESNPNRAHRGDIRTLIDRGIVDPGASEASWMYEAWPVGQKGSPQPLDPEACGWSAKQDGSTKCFLCSGRGEGRSTPVNPNEIFISCPGIDGPVYAGCNFAALAPYHMTAFQATATQQRVDQKTVARSVELLHHLGRGGVATTRPFTVIHNGDLIRSVDDEGKSVSQGAGATLLHDHNQFMRADLPLLHAARRCETATGAVKTAIVEWPSSVVRLDCPATERAALVDRANEVIRAWQKLGDRNTVNLIATYDGQSDMILFIAFRQIGLADAPQKPCVASLEQAGIIVLDNQEMFARYLADEDGRLDLLTTTLQAVDPLYAEADGDLEQRERLLLGLLAP